MKTALQTAAAALWLTACGSSHAVAHDASHARTDLPTLAFDLPRLSGDRLDARALRGKYVVIKPFAAWCEACRDELPRLLSVAARYRGANVEFVGVAMDRDSEASQHLVMELAIPFPVVWDPDATLGRALHLSALSEMFLFDPTGTPVVAYAKCDAATVADLERRLRGRSKSPSKSAPLASTR